MAAKKNSASDLRFVADMTYPELLAWLRRKSFEAEDQENSIIIKDKNNTHVATFNKNKNQLYSAVPIW